MWVSLYEHYIPTIAGCILPSCFACLWAKLARINQQHCSQVGIVDQLKAGTSLGPAGSKLGTVDTSPLSSSAQPDVSTVLSFLACWPPCGSCQNHGLLIFASANVHCSRPWQHLQQVRMGGGVQRKDGLGEAQRCHNQFPLIIPVICTFQGCKAVSIFRN